MLQLQTSVKYLGYNAGHPNFMCKYLPIDLEALIHSLTASTHAVPVILQHAIQPQKGVCTRRHPVLR